jgi:hypothetical protein
MKISPSVTFKMRSLFTLFLLLFVASVATGGSSMETKPVSIDKNSIEGLIAFADATDWNTSKCVYSGLAFSAFDEVSRTGGPSTTSKRAFVYFQTYDYCMYELTEIRMEVPADLVVSLKTAGTVRANLTAEVEKCVSEYTFDWEDLISISCATVPVEGSLSASFYPFGPLAKSVSRSQKAYHGYHRKVWYTGTSIDATVDLAGTILDGVPFVQDHAVGSIVKSSHGGMEIIKF